MGTNPPGLASLNAAVVNAQGQSAGPFMARTRPPPSNWAPYAYVDNGNGTFTLTASSATDATTFTLP